MLLSPEQVHRKLNEIHGTLAALAVFGETNPASLSLWTRGAIELPESTRDRINYAVHAMVEVYDELPFPPDWRQHGRLKAVIAEKVAKMRAERSAALRRNYESSYATAQ